MGVKWCFEFFLVSRPLAAEVRWLVSSLVGQLFRWLVGRLSMPEAHTFYFHLLPDPQPAVLRQLPAAQPGIAVPPPELGYGRRYGDALHLPGHGRWDDRVSRASSVSRTRVTLLILVMEAVTLLGFAPVTLLGFAPSR